MRGHSRRIWILLGGAVAVGAALLLPLVSTTTYSNIHPQDYVGPATCVQCHQENHQENFDSWQTHPHRVMNQNATDESVKGDFSGERLDYGHGHVIFHRDDRRFLMSLYEDGELLRQHEVTRTVGSLYVQYYIGRQVLGPEPPSHRTYRIESKLPFGYSINLQRWLPEQYFDSTVPPESAFLEGGSREGYLYGAPTHLWNSSCLQCHNTYPYESRLLVGGPWRAGYPREAVEWRGGAAHGGDQELKSSSRVPGDDELVTVGISCESCHFGGREHAVENREIRFVPTSPKLTIQHPLTKQPAESDRDDPFVINSICAQCHCASLNLYPNGSPAVNSNEATALASGACASAIKCTDCHNPHRHGEPSGAPDLEAHTQACLNCHPKFEAPAARAEHTRHSERVSCLDCHMPRTVAGLDTAVRSHQICQPLDRAMLESRSLNACNLCHLDETITWTLAELERGWGIEAPSSDLVNRWYGIDWNTPMGEVWGRSPSQFVRLAAMEAAARSPRVQDPVAAIVRGMNDAYPYNRTLALVTLGRHLGRRVSVEEFDLLADGATRRRQGAALEQSLRTETR